MLGQSVIVAAHPDDEVLWMSSVLARVDDIILCYLEYAPQPALGKGREGVLSHYPLPNVHCLGLREAESFNHADWRNPRLNRHGLEISGGRDVSLRYRENYLQLFSLLRERLGKARNVITHNPWGEYGHEDHVQVYQVIKALQHEHQFDIWFSNYFSARSALLMGACLAGQDFCLQTLKTDKALARELSSLYRDNGCWTWPRDYEWPEEESFIRIAAEGETLPYATGSRDCLPMNFIRDDPGGARAPGRKPPGFHKRIFRSIKRFKNAEKNKK